jgi:hypothetical protein
MNDHPLELGDIRLGGFSLGDNFIRHVRQRLQVSAERGDVATDDPDPFGFASGGGKNLPAVEPRGALPGAEGRGDARETLFPVSPVAIPRLSAEPPGSFVERRLPWRQRYFDLRRVKINGRAGGREKGE